MRTLADIAGLLVRCLHTETASRKGWHHSRKRENDLSLVAPKLISRSSSSTRAAALIVQRKVKLPAEWRRPSLLVDDVDLAIARILPLFAPPVPQPPPGIDSICQCRD